MPDGNAPSPLPQPDLSGLFADAERALQRLQGHAETFTLAAEAVVNGFDEANEMVRIGPKFQADMLNAQEAARPFAQKGREIMERAEAGLRRLRAEAQEMEGRSPTEQREALAAVRGELAAIGTETEALRSASEHFELVAADLSRRGDTLGEMNPMAGERFHALSRIASQASFESLDGSTQAARVAEVAPDLEAAEGLLAHTDEALTEPERATEMAEPATSSAPAVETGPVEAERTRLPDSLAERRRAKSAATETGPVQATSLGNPPETSTVAHAGLSDALQEASEKTQEKENTTAPEPERAVSEPTATERITKPPATEPPDRPGAPAEGAPAEPERPSPAPTASGLNSAAIASAIQNTLAPQQDVQEPAQPEEEPPANAQAEGAGQVTPAEERAIEEALAELRGKNATRKAANEAPASAQVGPATAPTDARAPRAIRRSEAEAIRDARAELKGKYAERARNAEIVALYGERMSARGWEYLQSHDPARYGQLQAAQATVQNLRIDATIFLQPEERQAVHLAATVDVRAAFPDLTDALLSAVLLQQSLAMLDQQEKADRQAALAAVAAVMAGGAAQASGTLATPAVFAALTKQISATREALAQEEKRAEERADAIRVQTQTPRPAGGGTVAQAVPAASGSVADLQAQQRQGLDTRRALQATLHAQVQQLAAGNALGNALAGQEALTGAQAQAANGLLAFIVPANLRPAAQGERVGTADGRSLLTGSRQNEAQQKEETVDPADRAAYENDLAAKLAARQIQDRRFQDISRASVGAGGGAGGSASASLIGNDGNPLLEGKRLRPRSPQEIFAEKQAAMRRRAEEFTGVGAAAGGFEATFGTGEALPNAEAGVIELQDGDLLPIGDGSEETATDETEEEETRLQELLQRQQADRLQGNQAARLDELRKAKDLLSSPAGKQALTKAAPLLSNPVALVIAALLLIVWLNARLFFPDESSMLRKPLGTWGKVGTIALDLFAVINTAVSFALLVIICILPFLPVLLALGGIFATLQGSLRLFGN